MMQLLLGLGIVFGLGLVFLTLSGHIEKFFTYLVKKFNAPYTEDTTSCPGIDCLECNDISDKVEDHFEELDLDTIYRHFEELDLDTIYRHFNKDRTPTWSRTFEVPEVAKSDLWSDGVLDDVIQFARIIEGDIRVGDCFVEVEGDGEGCVRIITKLHGNNDIAYEYLGDVYGAPYMINQSSGGVSKKEISESIESGLLQYFGTFDLGNDYE
jgi:hypothetical protein